MYTQRETALLRKNRITGMSWSAMDLLANYEGRTLAQVLTGKDKTYPGVLGTEVVKLPGMNVGRTGLTEAQGQEKQDMMWRPCSL